MLTVFCFSQEVNIEFEAHSISDNDCNGIKKLLQQVRSEFCDFFVNSVDISIVMA